MIARTAQAIDSTKILSKSEITAILSDLQRRSRRSVNWQLTLVLFRLSCMCGLRVSEIASLTLQDVVLTREKPHIHVRHGKGGKSGKVPLWVDRGTLDDLRTWKEFRLSQGACQADPFLCHQRKGTTGQPLAVRSLQDRWHTAMRKVLEPERAVQLSIHSGRHTAASVLLDGGYSLAFVRDYLRHSSVSVTSVYLHVVQDDGCDVGRVFEF